MVDEINPKKRMPFVLSEEDIEKIKNQFKDININRQKIEKMLKEKNQKEDNEQES
jgi:hypothetical protein